MAVSSENGGPQLAKPHLADVLAEVNKVRADLNLPPLDAMPKGTSACDDCPLAWAFGADYVEPGENGRRGHYILRGQTKIHYLSTTLNQFARAFDNRMYPELDR